MKPQANGSHFNFVSNNNSEASIELEKIIVDGKWSAPSTGVHWCGSGNINGGGRSGSVSSSTPAPKNTIYLEWYAWREKARMKATIELPGENVIYPLLLNPPWPKNSYGIDKSYFIVDFRPKHKVWIKLANTLSPKSQDQVMIIAEGKGIEKGGDVIKDYISFEEGKDYELDCVSQRKRVKALGGYSGSITTFDQWYPGAPENKELGYE
ncbi:hypothetical protein [Kangiella shandongensis]|uniref:hypothetical protein n=1 Tax=Kangiella shandongensis TaxID=2763258 RepID=UPI001CBD1DC0|nr:hypothetical protein [Kangiella shandongensis]